MEMKYIKKSKPTYQSIREKIQDIKEDAIKGQKEIENTYKNFNKDYRDRGKNW